MPQAFDNCVEKGGEVRTKSLSKGKYMHICILNGKTHPGYVKMKKVKHNGNHKGKDTD